MTFLDSGLLSKCNYFCLSQVDCKEEDIAQILYGLFIINNILDGEKKYDRKISQSIVTRLSVLHKFIEEKSENLFSGDLKPNGRTLGFIGKEFKKFFDETSDLSHNNIYSNLAHISRFSWNY